MKSCEILFKTIKCQLLEYEKELYIHYVFKNLDTNDYIMVSRYPNWDHKDLEIGDIGYLTYYDVYAGKTTFVMNDIEYRYSTTHTAFYKFIWEKEEKFNHNNKIIKL